MEEHSGGNKLGAHLGNLGVAEREQAVFLWGPCLCHSQEGMFESLHFLQAWQIPAGPFHPPALAGLCHHQGWAQMPPAPSPSVTLQAPGFVLNYLWLPCTVYHLSLLSSRADYND